MVVGSTPSTPMSAAQPGNPGLSALITGQFVSSFVPFTFVSVPILFVL